MICCLPALVQSHSFLQGCLPDYIRVISSSTNFSSGVGFLLLGFALDFERVAVVIGFELLLKF